MEERGDLIERTITGIEKSIADGVFIDYENEIIELKDLSGGSEWTSLKQTVCAYLNTNGGYIICGVREREVNAAKSYNLTGFDRNNEGKLIALQTSEFKNDNDVFISLYNNISFEYSQLLGKTIVIITITPLSEDLKYIKYNNVYYERILTQDKVILESKLTRHREYKAELEYSKEISLVKGATINDLDIDKINQFIIKINTTGKKDTVKKDIDDAIDFLKRRYCINAEKQITVLGMLLFGKYPYQFLGDRAAVDCYFETGSSIGKDKKNFEDDVLNLMDDTFSFVWGHIKIGRSYVGGGRSEPEFPQKLIREVINNALAHRDYTINKFITVKINPGEGIEIKNPGSFKQKMIIKDTSEKHEIRRIIAGVPETKNPKLANVLKAFEKVESQGIGMATLVSVCLDNEIDVPYYDLSTPDNISLIIPSGQLIDDPTQIWINSYYQFLNKKLNGKIRREHELVIAYLLKSEQLNQRRLYTILLSPSNNHMDVLRDLKAAGLIHEYFTPFSEQSPIYLLTEELKQTDFTKRIEKLLNIDLSPFDITAKQVLNIIYRYNYYNNQSIKPNVITPELYYQLFGKDINPTKYESLGRKVRKICADLTKMNYLIKFKDKSYELRDVFLY